MFVPGEILQDVGVTFRPPPQGPWNRPGGRGITKKIYTACGPSMLEDSVGRSHHLVSRIRTVRFNNEVQYRAHGQSAFEQVLHSDTWRLINDSSK